MKIIVCLLISLLFMACNGQSNDKLKKIPMTIEKFNIEQYNKGIKYDYIHTDGSGNKTHMKGENSTYERELKDGTVVIQFGDENMGYVEYVMPPPPAIFGSFKEFYANGELKAKIDKTTIGQYLNSNGNYEPIIGIVPLPDESAKKIIYDENGKPVAIESYADMMKGLKIQAEQLFDILEKEKLFDRNKTKPDPTDILEKYRGGIEVAFHSDHPMQPDTFLIAEFKFVKGENYWWEVKKTYRPRPIKIGSQDYKQRKVVYKIDAVTGEVKKLKDELLEPSGE